MTEEHQHNGRRLKGQPKKVKAALVLLIMISLSYAIGLCMGHARDGGSRRSPNIAVRGDTQGGYEAVAVLDGDESTEDVNAPEELEGSEEIMIFDELQTPAAGPELPTRVTTAKFATEDETAIYDAIVDGIQNFTTAEFVVRPESGIGTKRIAEIASVAGNTPELFWLDQMLWQTWEDNADGSKTYKIEMSYWMTREERDAALEEIRPLANEIIQAGQGADIEAASVIVNNAIARRTTYQYDTSIQLNHPYDTILGPLVEGESICSGYGKTYSYLMGLLGHSTAYCMGHTANDVYHAWNRLEIDGETCYTDVTFNWNVSGYDKILNCPISDSDGRTIDKEYWYVPYTGTDSDVDAAMQEPITTPAPEQAN